MRLVRPRAPPRSSRSAGVPPDLAPLRRPPARPRALRVRVGDVTLHLHSHEGFPLAPARRAARLPRHARSRHRRRGRDARAPARRRRRTPLFVSGGLWTVYRQGRAAPLRDPRARARPRAALPPSSSTRRRAEGPALPARGRALRAALPARRAAVPAPPRPARRDGGPRLRRGLGGRALLFCGVSGAGKTTTARPLAPPPAARGGAQRRPHDRARARRGRLWAFGTPWHGSGRFASPRGLPLGGDLLPRPRPPPSRHADAPPAAAAELFARSFPPPWEAAGSTRVLALCARVAARGALRPAPLPARPSAVAAVLEAPPG